MLSGTPFYNQTVRKAVAVFGTIFNNIYIQKPNKAKERVPISYGPAQKFISRLNDGGGDTDRIAIKVPRMSFQITSIEYDSERALNKMQKHKYGDIANNPHTVFQGVPYNIAMDLTVISKDQDAALQIVEQILPTFRPEYTIAIKDMERPGKSMDVPIILTNIGLEDDYEGDYETRRALTYTLSFTMKVKFYGEVVKSPIVRTAEVYFHNSPALATGLSADTPSLGGVKSFIDSPTDSPNSFTAKTLFGFNSPPIR